VEAAQIHPLTWPRPRAVVRRHRPRESEGGVDTGATVAAEAAKTLAVQKAGPILLADSARALADAPTIPKPRPKGSLGYPPRCG
jgi:hypothetical protein